MPTLESCAPHVGLVHVRRHASREYVAILGDGVAEGLRHVLAQHGLRDTDATTGSEHAEALVEDRLDVTMLNMIAEDSAHDHVGGVVPGLHGGHR